LCKFWLLGIVVALDFEKVKGEGQMAIIQLEKKIPSISRASSRAPIFPQFKEETSSPFSSSFIIRPLCSEEDYQKVGELTYEAYLEQGYCRPHKSRRLIHYPHLEKITETTILGAFKGDLLVGSISLTLDGPLGIHADTDFKEECDQIRQEGKNMASCWRVVTRKFFRHETILLLKMFQEVVRLGNQNEVQTGLFTLNPRHEKCYQKIFDMKTVARKQNTRGLKNAPALLMRWDLENSTN